MDIIITDKQFDKIVELIRTNNIYKVVKMFGGIENVQKIIGDRLVEYYSRTGIKPYEITSDGMAMYIDQLLLSTIPVSEAKFVFNRGEFELGHFRWTSGGMNYKFTAYLYPLTLSGGGIKYKVVGNSGDHGFDQSWITKRNTIGKRGRTQIFKQIIEKFNLNKYNEN